MKILETDPEFFKDCIYIGKGYTRLFKEPFWLVGFGDISQSTINYGQTGYAYEDENQWCFRPDGLNIDHYVKKSDLHFIEE